MEYQMKPIDHPDRSLELQTDLSWIPYRIRLSFNDHGTRLPAGLPELVYKREDKGTDFDDFMIGTTTNELLVSERFKTFIEMYAKDRIEFHPARIEGVDRRYFLFHFVDVIRSVIPELSEVVPQYLPNQDEMYAYSLNMYSRITFNQDIVAGRGIWAEEYISRYVFISESFRQGLITHKFTGTAIRPVSAASG